MRRCMSREPQGRVFAVMEAGGCRMGERLKFWTWEGAPGGRVQRPLPAPCFFAARRHQTKHSRVAVIFCNPLDRFLAMLAQMLASVIGRDVVSLRPPPPPPPSRPGPDGVWQRSAWATLPHYPWT